MPTSVFHRHIHKVHTAVQWWLFSPANSDFCQKGWSHPSLPVFAVLCQHQHLCWCNTYFPEYRIRATKNWSKWKLTCVEKWLQSDCEAVSHNPVSNSLSSFQPFYECTIVKTICLSKSSSGLLDKYSGQWRLHLICINPLQGWVAQKKLKAVRFAPCWILHASTVPQILQAIHPPSYVCWSWLKRHLGLSIGAAVL